MFEILILTLAIALGMAGGYFLYAYQKKQPKAQQNSVLMLEHIKKACKLITVESDWAEIITHHEPKNYFWKLIQVEKKAMMVVKAKAMVGFDMRKAQIELDSHNRVIKIHTMPEPEILSIVPEIQYYDISQSMFTTFNHNELTQIQQNVITQLREKIWQSQMPHMALEQAQQTLETISNLAQLLQWKLEYKLPNYNPKALDAQNSKALSA